MAIVIQFIFTAIRLAATFLFGSTGETITEKSGHLNLGTPGIMCVGALFGCLGESIYLSGITDQSQVVPFLAIFIPIIFTIIGSVLMGLIYAFICVTLRANQNVTGLILTTFGIGITNFFINNVDKTKFTYTTSYFTTLFPSSWSDILGGFGKVIFGYGFLVYFAIILAIVAQIVLNKTKLGLQLRAVGENPATADAAGINVSAYRYGATLIGSAISGLGGTFYIMDYLYGMWEYNIDAMGWIAVALVIFTVWKPALSIIGSIVFGALFILCNYINVSSSVLDLVNVLPYVVTIVVLVVTSFFRKKETQPPASLGLNYFREDR